MCLAIPSKIISVDRDKCQALVDTMGVKREARLDLVEESSLKVGDYVLIHVGYIMNKIDEDKALESIEFYKNILKDENN